jgi:uncharacterized protein YjbI with pentapeptide repeats
LTQAAFNDSTKWGLAFYSDATQWPHNDFRFRSYGMLGPESDLEGADLSDMDLDGINLHDANMKGATMNRTDASGVTFTNVNLESSNLQGADLSDTSFAGASLVKANVLASSIDGADFHGAFCSQDTIFGGHATRAFLFVVEVQVGLPPVIIIDILPGWSIGGTCCFPTNAGAPIGCSF